MELDGLSLEFETDAPLAQPLEVVDASLREAVSEPYLLRATLRLVDADDDATSLLGREATVAFGRAPLRRVTRGIIRTVREGHHRADGQTEVQVDVVPGFALLSLRRNTRMFQQQTAPQILEAVLGEALGQYGRRAQLDLDAEYPRREYCLQYQESDLDFVSRLMEEEGIHYVFDQTGDTEVLWLRDGNRFAEPVETTTPGVLPFEPQALNVVDVEPIHRFVRLEEATTNAVTVRDLDWTTGPLIVGAGREGMDQKGRTRESYEHGAGASLTVGDYSAGSRRYQANDAERQAELRLEAYAVSGVVARGIGRAVGLSAGQRFRVEGHPGVGVDGDYFVTRVLHKTEEAIELRRRGESEDYHNRFEAIPLSTPFRPARRTNKPVIPSMQTAIVAGPPGEEIHTDEWGRVQVHFHWDREHQGGDGSSTWVRVRQNWAGAGWGHLWVPRVGMEVVVQFTDGDPDLPLVTGALYNATHRPPYSLPAEKTKSTIKSNSSPGGGGFNEIRFEDAAGSEEMFIHSQKDTNAITNNNETISVGANQDVTVGANQDQTIGANQTEVVGANQDLTVGANRDVTVGATFTETIGASSTITVNGHATETLSAGETQTVNGGRTETVNGGETRTVNGGQTETVNGGVTQTVVGGVTQSIVGANSETFGAAHTNTTAGSLTHTVLGGVTTFSGGPYTLTALGGYVGVAGANLNYFTPGWMFNIAPAHHTRAAPTIDKLNLLSAKLRGLHLQQSGTRDAWQGLNLEATGIDVVARGYEGEFKITLKTEIEPLFLELTAPRAIGAALSLHIAGLHLFI